MLSTKIERIYLSNKCYICGRSKEDLNAINEKIVRKYEGGLKDFYIKYFGLKLAEKDYILPGLLHPKMKKLEWEKEFDRLLPKGIFHPNEETNQFILLGLKFGILKLIFNKNEDRIIPEIILTGEKPSDEQMKEFKRVDKNGWLRNNPQEKLMSDLENYCKQTKKDFSRSVSHGQYKYLKQGIIKLFSVNVRVYICSVCSSSKLPDILDEDDYYDDDSKKRFDGGLEYFDSV